MEEQNITRINELAHIAKERELTDEETAERNTLRQEYLASFRSSLKDQLEHTYVQYPDGTKVKLGEQKPE